nr:sulfur carrier protein ThiS [Enterovibrio paralichthyis]
MNDALYIPVTATDLSSLIAELSLPEQAVAIAVDGDIISRSQWQDTPLTEGIRVAMFQAIAGG